MSHYTLMVVGDDPDTQLEPYSEHKESEPRVYAEVSENDKKHFIDYYIKKDFKNELISFDKLYEIEGKGWNGNSWKKNADGVWEEWTTYNELSKWDWYVLGGRWSGLIKMKRNKKGTQGIPGVFDNETGIDQAIKKDIANFDELTTFAYLVNGEWIERGSMGWWGTVHKEKDEQKWTEEQKKIKDLIPDDALISIYDLHI
jgi:hypothetical protein